MKTYLRILFLLVLAVALHADDLFSQRRGGGGRGGGGGGFSSRGGARSSVSRPARSGGGVNRASRPRASQPIADRNRGVDRTVNRDINRERTVNRDREVDINRRGGDYGWYDGCCDHPIAATAAVVGTAAAVGAAYGSTYDSSYYYGGLPSGCTTAVYGGLTYSNCDGTWYQPQFSGSETTYVVVAAPD